MSQSLSLPPKRISKASALVWLGALGTLFVLVLALPLVLMREHALLYAEIQYHGIDHYPVVPIVPFPGPPVEATETFEIDGLRFSLPVGSVDYMTVGEELDGRLTIHLRDGLIVALDPPARPSPIHRDVDARIDAYAASPTEFSWRASGEQTRRLNRALALKKSLMFADSASGVSQVARPDWQGFVLHGPSLRLLNWLPTDESLTGIVWVHKPPGCNADGSALADVVFGSFEVLDPPRGMFDADVRRLAERFPKAALNE